MKTRNDLLEHQKRLYDKIDSFYINNQAIQRKDFVKVLGILINKYRFHTLREKGKPSAVSKEKSKK